MAACLSFFLPVGVPVVLLLHAHHDHGFHAHVTGPTAAATAHGEGHHAPSHRHSGGGEPRAEEAGHSSAPGILLVLEREAEPAPAPTLSPAAGTGEPPIDAAPPGDEFAPDVRRASSDPRVRARPPPPRRSLERLLSTSRALLL